MPALNLPHAPSRRKQLRFVQADGVNVMMRTIVKTQHRGHGGADGTLAADFEQDYQRFFDYVHPLKK